MNNINDIEIQMNFNVAPPSSCLLLGCTCSLALPASAIVYKLFPYLIVGYRLHGGALLIY